ncbi:MAG: preprotein translocase subunit SecG [Candidatus Omnitrophica bacterium]|nr:preprotein translocase subunit SecG [Candidatus Omnitrophota bacterium]
MMGLIIFLHVTICVLLIIIILIQAGRGGGLVEGFSGVESMFGPKTNAFLTRLTAILSVMFFCTCLTLAFLSAKQSRSLMRNIKTSTLPVQATTQTAPVNTQTAAPAQGQSTKQEPPAAQENSQQNTKEPVKTE